MPPLKKKIKSFLYGKTIVATLMIAAAVQTGLATVSASSTAAVNVCDYLEWLPVCSSQGSSAGTSTASEVPSADIPDGEAGADNTASVDNAGQEIVADQQELSDAPVVVQEFYQKYEDAQTVFLEVQNEYQDAQAELETSYQEYVDAQSSFAEAEKEYENAQEAVTEAKQIYENAVATLPQAIPDVQENIASDVADSSSASVPFVTVVPVSSSLPSCPVPECVAPPPGCHYEGLPGIDQNGCQVGCGGLVCTLLPSSSSLSSMAFSPSLPPPPSPVVPPPAQKPSLSNVGCEGALSSEEMKNVAAVCASRNHLLGTWYDDSQGANFIYPIAGDTGIRVCAENKDKVKSQNGLFIPVCAGIVQPGVHTFVY